MSDRVRRHTTVTSMRQWRRAEQLRYRFHPRVEYREPSRVGLLIASVICIAGAIACMWWLLETGIPAGLGR